MANSNRNLQVQHAAVAFQAPDDAGSDDDLLKLFFQRVGVPVEDDAKVA